MTNNYTNTPLVSAIAKDSDGNILNECPEIPIDECHCEILEWQELYPDCEITIANIVDLPDDCMDFETMTRFADAYSAISNEEHWEFAMLYYDDCHVLLTCDNEISNISYTLISDWDSFAMDMADEHIDCMFSANDAEFVKRWFDYPKWCNDLQYDYTILSNEHSQGDYVFIYG